MGLFPHALLLGALVLMTAGAPEIASAQTAFPAKRSRSWSRQQLEALRIRLRVSSLNQ